MVSLYARQHPMARYKYLDTLVLVFVVILLVSNLVAQKVCRLGPLTISGAELLFPITYIFGDVFTEVYGYQASRRAIWIGFFASALLSAAGAMAVALPADPGWHNQQAFETVFGLVPRFVAASLIAYWVASLPTRIPRPAQNPHPRSMALDPHHRIHHRRPGLRHLSRHGHLLRRPGLPATLIRLILSSYLIKVAYETLATPLTYAGVAWLKRREGVDPFDTQTDFNPFLLRNLPTASEMKAHDRRS